MGGTGRVGCDLAVAYWWVVRVLGASEGGVCTALESPGFHLGLLDFTSHCANYEYKRSLRTFFLRVKVEKFELLT